MKAKTLEGGEIDLKQADLDGLRAQLKGPMILPGEIGYAEFRTNRNILPVR